MKVKYYKKLLNVYILTLVQIILQEGNRDEMRWAYGIHETRNKRVSSTWQYQEVRSSKNYYNKSKEITTKKHNKNDAK
jgi:hypothetical protein